ncbi:molybdopterin converting factor subunit 1 [Anoxybacillus sp. LAT_35]|uniref:molybdopterin converting factor subunit 1 n=1 Tax=unclassified Anoxybacillus TaxID=2639704 RepID=UPI001EDB6885|nr:MULTISPECIES: molybdopterin converting factor subunit 1 [unclassified Anoxybacillus]MCG5024383.1 molybdopterin converting factor subunit 1 [Anoxybacillus flavithermus]MCG6198400.1 molybdopterin converting factor subunit 1 [Anoxybacillus sp. LAT_38]MCG3085664.1 molybdopterin converting factor subunit 1 [Anoxybacillus sp. LAT27]MCG6172012.1 molybdopterin converting factor subunit 1 [Anoxybacillus sp. LAT_11]MCG6174188.1 molybdopterin converting factor subunit 1 [Anoxybacillus sp. LAT_31]
MIRVLLFAYIKERLGTEEVVFHEQQMTVRQLRERLQHEYDLQTASSLMIAINEEFATNDDIIHAGDVVALIPPVSGG